MCTSTGHQANACFLKNKSNCTVIVQGRVCSVTHHHILHNTGVAYCNKVQLSAVSSTVLSRQGNMTPIDAGEIEPPNINQPVLLEVQAIPVDNNVMAKVM